MRVCPCGPRRARDVSAWRVTRWTCWRSPWPHHLDATLVRLRLERPRLTHTDRAMRLGALLHRQRHELPMLNLVGQLPQLAGELVTDPALVRPRQRHAHDPHPAHCRVDASTP